MAMYTYFIIACIILLALVLFWGFYRFQDAVSKERDELLGQSPKNQTRITPDDLRHLPKPVQHYLKKVGVIGKYKNNQVVFKQQGSIKTGIDKKWTRFRAIQYMTAHAPNFIWNAQTYPLFVRDKSIGGQGEVRINLFGLKDIAVYQDVKTDQSALARCLGELVLFPLGFLSEKISWEPIDDKKVKASVQMKDTRAEGIFFFDGNGLITGFQTKRYMGASLEQFSGITENYKPMDGLLVPETIRAIWNLESGDFEYFKATISDYRLQ